MLEESDSIARTQVLLVPPAPVRAAIISRAKETALRREGGPAASALARAASAVIPLDEVVRDLVVAFRKHPHISNVFTHISRGNWSQVEQALRVILDPGSGNRDLSPLARNMVELMCADRGVTGRILKPYFHSLIASLLAPPLATRLTAHVTSLFEEYEAGLPERRGQRAPQTSGRH